MRKVILTAPNGKVYMTKTNHSINDNFIALHPSIIDTTRYFSEGDLKFIKETLIPQGRVTAIDGLQFIARGSTIFSTRLDGRTKEAKSYEYFSWDKAYQFVKDNQKIFSF